MENYILREREINQSIEAYLCDVLTEINSLDYTVGMIFNTEELSEVLKEDLPTGNSLIDRDKFIVDIVQVCSDFFKQTENRKMRIQIEVIDDDMCRLFHVDHLRQRLLCTYLGPGTQWLDNTNVNREWLGKGDNQKIVKDFSQIRQTTPFDILLLRGGLFESGFEGAVHRSPPISEAKVRRVLLKLDEL